MKSMIVGTVFGLFAQVGACKPAPHVPLGVVSDWTHNHVLYPDSKDNSLKTRNRTDPRWVQNWYLRHREVWWPGHPRWSGGAIKGSNRDWSVPLAVTPKTSGFEPLFEFNFAIGPDTGYGSLKTTDSANGVFLATAGTLAVTGGKRLGKYSLYPGGPAEISSPSGYFLYDNLLHPSTTTPIDNGGPLFTGNGLEINIFSVGSNTYQFYDNSGYNTLGEPFILKATPGGGQTYPAKFVFDVTATPSCTSDFVVIGVPANTAPGGQANIVGYNNLYSSQGASSSNPTPYCNTNGPTVMFAYASGTGQVPNYVTISQSGAQIAYIENVISGSSYFHVLTIGKTGTNGTSATAAVVPGSAGGNNAIDQTVLLSPDGGVTTQSSTNAAFVVYTPNDLTDVAYVTTYSTAGNDSGYLYKIGNVFNQSAAPAIIWSAPISAVPSTPVYDGVSNRVFFTDSNGRIDYVQDTGTSPSVIYGAIVASGATSENPITLDSTNQMIYACFNTNGTNAIVVQAPTSLASTASVSVGTGSTAYTGPYGVDFNNAWYSGSGTPLMYVVGTGTGTIPTLYGVGFDKSGMLDPADITMTALATAMADSSPVTEFYNTLLQKDYLFAGVTNNCIATTQGGTAGCVMSLDITGGFPTVNANSTSLPAPGGTSGIIVDNDSSLTETASIYYATKTGVTLVKATQLGLN